MAKEDNILKIPNLFIAGFQKCATTTLFEVLRGHPEIGVALDWEGSQAEWPLKEPGFFGENYGKGIKWYQSLYAGCKESQLLDGTPNYAASDCSMKRLARTVPDAKLILSLRDPVKRARSSWNHWIQLPENKRWPGMFDPDGDFESNVRAEVDNGHLESCNSRLIGAGYYFDQIQRILKYFQPSQLHITSAEWINRNFIEELHCIQEFLELDIVDLEERRSHERQYVVDPIKPKTEILLREVYREHDERLRKFLGRELPWE